LELLFFLKKEKMMTTMFVIVVFFLQSRVRIKNIEKKTTMAAYHHLFLKQTYKEKEKK